LFRCPRSMFGADRQRHRWHWPAPKTRHASPARRRAVRFPQRWTGVRVGQMRARAGGRRSLRARCCRARGRGAPSSAVGGSRQGGQLQPLCLYQSYLTPPRTNTLAGLTLYPQLQEELDKVAGRPHPALAQHERRDNFEGWKETQWTLLNLPLLAVDALQRQGWEGALRQRHDAALEQLFQWSEQHQDNKVIYRRLLPLMQPVLTELQQLYAGQGLDSADARTAAELLLH